jgi:hypothetical protein
MSNKEKEISEIAILIEMECDSIKSMLLAKNRKYGNSALNPVRIFSKASPDEAILVRLDDKLSRIKEGSTDEDEDVYLDLLGYLILLKVSKKLAKTKKQLTDK